MKLNEQVLDARIRGNMENTFKGAADKNELIPLYPTNRPTSSFQTRFSPGQLRGCER